MRTVSPLIVAIAHTVSTLAACAADPPAAPSQQDQRSYSSALIVCGGVIPGTQGLKTFTLQVWPYGDVPQKFSANLPPTLAVPLRAAGANVVLRGEAGFNDIKDYLAISIKAYKSSDGTQCAWGVDIDLHQPVQLARDPMILPTNALTSHNWRQGIVPCSELESTLRSNALDFVQQFAWNYKHENE